MDKGFSEKFVGDDKSKDVSSTPKKGLGSFLKNKEITYTLPGKRQINIFAGIVLGLNFLLVIAVIFYQKNQVFHDYIFNIGR